KKIILSKASITCETEQYSEPGEPYLKRAQHPNGINFNRELFSQDLIDRLKRHRMIIGSCFAVYFFGHSEPLLGLSQSGVQRRQKFSSSYLDQECFQFGIHSFVTRTDGN